MSTYIAKSDQPAELLAFERKLYRDNVRITNSKNFWDKDCLYGKVDKYGNAISLSETNLKQLASGGKTLFTIDFVADAYNMLKQELTRKLRRRGLSFSDVGITSLDPDVSWVSVNNLYHFAMQSLYVLFFSIYIKNFRREHNIKDFDSFVTEFLYFLHGTKESLPVTKSSFIKSNKCPPLISGLLLELKPKMHDDDQPKEKIETWAGFETYRKAAWRYGFVLNYNNPYQLIFNVSSVKAAPFMQKYGITTESGGPGDLFEVYYYKVGMQQDIDALKSYLVQFYGSFITAKPFVSVKGRPRNRQPFSEGKKYDENYWLKLYAIVKFFESGKQLNFKESIDRVSKALALQKYLDPAVAIRYICKESES